MISPVLHVSAATVIEQLKKFHNPNRQSDPVDSPDSAQVEVDIVRVEATEEYGIEKSELDQMWCYVGKKTNPRWLWHAIDRSTGQVLAYVLASER